MGLTSCAFKPLTVQKVKRVIVIKTLILGMAKFSLVAGSIKSLKCASMFSVSWRKGWTAQGKDLDRINAFPRSALPVPQCQYDIRHLGICQSFHLVQHSC